MPTAPPSPNIIVIGSVSPCFAECRPKPKINRMLSFFLSISIQKNGICGSSFHSKKFHTVVYGGPVICVVIKIRSHNLQALGQGTGSCAGDLRTGRRDWASGLLSTLCPPTHTHTLYHTPPQVNMAGQTQCDRCAQSPMSLHRGEL